MNPAPARTAEVTDTGKLPDAVRTKSCVTGVFTAVVPNEMPVELNERIGPPGASCNAKVDELPVADAVSVAACAALTVETLALKFTDVEFAGTVTEAGSITALALLDRFTLSPPVGAAALRVTEQESVAEPETVDRLHFNPVMPGVPAPLSPIFVAPKETALVPTTSCPLVGPEAEGLN